MLRAMLLIRVNSKHNIYHNIISYNIFLHAVILTVNYAMNII